MNFNPQFFIRIALGLMPVLIFLSTLMVLDSFKLIRARAILLTLGIGGLAALLCWFANSFVLQTTGWEMRWYARYGSPVLEEFCKALYLVYLIKASRVGFMVDSAIHGFAVGAGFACVENIYYLQSLSDPNVLLWIMRGFGTAIMHGGATAMFAILAKSAADQRMTTNWRVFLPGLAVAVAIHSFFNHFLLPPLLMTLLLILSLPLLMVIVFQKSENSTRAWLEVGFDTDRELLELILSEPMSTSRIGLYLQSLRKTFPSEIVMDLICYLRLHLELSIKAKGMLLMREAGFTPAPDPEINKTLSELAYLKKSIGKTGMLALAPFVSIKSQDLWQLQILGK